MGKLLKLIDALYLGKSLTNAATWKNRQATANALATVFAAIVLFVPSLQGHYTQEELNTICLGAATFGGLLNAYFTVATSDKIGLPIDTPPAIPEPDLQSKAQASITGH